MAKYLLEKEKYTTKDGIERFSYVVKGSVKGTSVKAYMTPPDFGGYQILDIIFGDKMSAELVASPFEIKSEDGSVIKGNTYSVKSVDEKGEVFELKMKPSKASDKAILKMLIR